MLRESLGGNSKTNLIITCSPSVLNRTETLNSLRFGSRASKIMNRPIVNIEHTVPDLLKQLSKRDEQIELKETRILAFKNYIQYILAQTLPEE